MEFALTCVGQPGRQADGVPLEEPSAFVDYGGYTVVGKKRGTTAARKCKFVGFASVAVPKTPVHEPYKTETLRNRPADYG